MKRFIVMALLLSSVSLHANISDASWKLKNNFTVSKVWQSLTDSNLYVSIEKNKVEDVAAYKNILKDKASLAKFEEEKKNILGLIGVSKWTASSKEWIKLSGRDFLKLQGTYEDNADETVHFREYHLVEDGKVLQILFTSTKKDSYTSLNDIEQFLKDVKMDVISE